MAYDSYPSGMSTADLMYVGEITDPATTALENEYDDWREEKILETWDDVCSNLSIEIENIEQLYKDDTVRELIIAAHEKQWPDTWDENQFLEEWDQQ